MNTKINNLVEKAANVFRYLQELKKLQSPLISDCKQYEEVLWISEIPKEKGCYSKAWMLIRDDETEEHDIWIEITKPKLESPPEIPDGLEHFISYDQLNQSSEEPNLLEVSDEILRKHFLTDDEYEPDKEHLLIDENQEIYDKYVLYVTNQWIPWAQQRKENIETKEPFPEPPNELLMWLNKEELPNYDLEEPSLHEDITIEIDRRIDQIKKELIDSWNDYLENKWKPWAETDKRLQIVQNIYTQLFKIYQRQHRLGEQYEVVLCFGLLTWKAKNIRRHVLTVQCNLAFNPSTGVMSIGPTAEGNSPALEYDMLETTDRPQEREMKFLQDLNSDIGEEFWDQAKLTSILSGFANAISTEGLEGFETRVGYENILDKPNNSPMVTLTPAIILRRRSQKGYIQFLEKIEKTILSEGEISRGISEIVSGGDEPEISNSIEKNDETSEMLPTRIEETEVYFPLPANEEQREIIHRLKQGRGVLVQGPPGTGKSHTIVNLICHLLSEGKKILVTSETKRALESLRSRFRDGASSLFDLCVILLGNDEQAFQELEKSVKSISNKKNLWKPNESNEHIKELRNKLDQIRRNKKIISQKLRDIREQDNIRHELKFERYTGTLQEIAKQINEEALTYEWLKDRPKHSFDFANLNITAKDFVTSWDKFKHLHKLEIDLIEEPLEKLPTPQQVKELIKEIDDRLFSINRYESQADSQASEFLKDIPTDLLNSIDEDAHRILNSYLELEQHLHTWAGNAAKEILAEQDRKWFHLRDYTKKKLKKVSELISKVEEKQVDGLKFDNLKVIHSHINALIKHLMLGKSLRFKLFQPTEIKEAFYITHDCQIDGKRANKIEILEDLEKWISVKIALEDIGNLWSGITTINPGPFSIEVAQFEDLQEPLEIALGLHPLRQRVQTAVSGIQRLKPPKWHIRKELESFCFSLAALRTERELIRFTNGLEKLIKLVRSLSELDPSLKDGMAKALYEKNGEAYRNCYAALIKKNNVTREQLNLIKKTRPLNELLPLTIKEFFKCPNDEQWIERFNNLLTATQHSLASQWLDEICDPLSAQKLNANYELLEKQELQVIGELAEELAWKHCMERLTEGQRQSLVAWLQAVRNIGAGYGRHAERHRRTAREKMKECRGAIPAWVMPLHRVVETVASKPNIFDVAIIDEASQSGPEALILNFIAKKVIVVGDDKQIRPSYIGINHDDVEYYRNLHLKDIPHSESFDLNGSYFSQAELRFKDYIRLKEHFRCMPEIIQFSNNNFYTSEPLIPLRQFGAGRLKPVVSHFFVEDGYRTGEQSKIINRPEAEAIVQKITELNEDPKYENKTMGVITLLGNKQAVLIEELLYKELDAGDIEKRKLVVGIPNSFQGDERDVIFLSMVDSPRDGRACRAVTDQDNQRQYNVAASRARDQMLLFHSADLNDLRAGCLKQKLLSHCINPKVEQSEIDGISLQELRTLAYTSHRTRENYPPPFDSWFEVDVFIDITNRGFRVLPQYRVNPSERSYRIDMVIQGLQGQLAVECDGDKWHGPERYEQDMARQRDLMRAGFDFWRVRGGTYYRDKEAALSSLWDELKQAGIYPEGQDHEEEAYQDNTEEPRQHHQDNKEEPKQYQNNRQIILDIQEEENLPIFNQSKPTAEENKTEKEKQSPPKKTNEPTANEIQKAILHILKNRPNNSIALKHLTKGICDTLSIRTRGNPRKELDTRIRRNVGVLKRNGLVEEYKARNVRIRLLQ